VHLHVGQMLAHKGELLLAVAAAHDLGQLVQLQCLVDRVRQRVRVDLKYIG
jgi:hypothetical protein